MTTRPAAFGRTALRAIGVAAVLLLAACKVDLYSGLGEREANEMVATLLDNGIPAERIAADDETLTVRVEEGRFAQAVELLKANGLPRERYATMGQVFASDSLIASPVEERARMIYALSQELAQTISEIDGVLSSRVHVVLPDNDPLRAGLRPSSSSVFIRYDKTTPVAGLIPQIKTLVANGIEGLKYDNVSVVLFPVALRPQARPAPVEVKTATADLSGSFAGIARLAEPRNAPYLIAGLVGLAVAALLGNAVLYRRWRRRSGAA